MRKNKVSGKIKCKKTDGNAMKGNEQLRHTQLT